MRRQPRGPLEQPCEVIRAHVDDRPEVGQPELALQVVVDVRLHSAEAAFGQRPDDTPRSGVARCVVKFRRRVRAFVAHRRERTLFRRVDRAVRIGRHRPGRRDR